MSPATVFRIHLVLGYVPWLLFFGAYVLPKRKSMDRIEAQRAIATLHSFRFFGLVFILPGVVRRLRRLRRLRDRCTGDAGASHGEDTSAFLAVRRRLQSRGGRRHPHRLLSRKPGRPCRAGRGVGRHLRDPDHLCAPVDDHALHRILFAVASSTQGCSGVRRRCGRILDRIRRQSCGPPTEERFCFSQRSDIGIRVVSVRREGHGAPSILASSRVAPPLCRR